MVGLDNNSIGWSYSRRSADLDLLEDLINDVYLHDRNLGGKSVDGLVVNFCDDKVHIPLRDY